MAQTRSYDQYLTRVAGMIGMPVGGMTTDELGFLNAFFNNNERSMWQLNNWLDVCPYGEARFAGNLLRYMNDLTQVAYWGRVGMNATFGVLRNPLDSRMTVSSLMETATVSQHYISQVTECIPGVSYTYSTYARAIAGRQVSLKCIEGVTSHTASFNLTAGTISTQIALSQTATIQQQANGFFLCSISFVASAAATSCQALIYTSIDGINDTFLGSTSAGVYLWGTLLQQTSNTAANTYTIAYQQDGERAIDAAFQVLASNPNATPYPREVAYNMGVAGIHLIGTGGYTNNYFGTAPSFSSPITNPVFLNYRIAPPDYLGAAYNALLAYAVGSTMLYTYADGVTQNFFTCAAATSAGQNPENTPGNWTISTIYDFTFQYACYAGYADWLRQDGQFDKANLMDQLAQKQMDDESDRMERQQGHVLPMKVSTHVTSQSRYQ